MWKDAAKEAYSDAMKRCSGNTNLDETELVGNFSARELRRIYEGLTLNTRVPAFGGGESV